MIQIPLTQGYVAFVDDVDAHLAALKWAATVRRDAVYAVRNVKIPRTRRSNTILLHRAVMGLKPGDPPVDHIDGDGLNCRRANLRLVTTSENLRNRASTSTRANGASTYLGVSRSRSRWRAQITVDGKTRHLGVFPTAEAANMARLAAEKEIWGIQPRRAAAHGRAQ